MPYEEYTALVAGAGSIGRRHARNLRDVGAAVAAFDPDTEARDRISDELDVESFADMEAALDGADPDLAVVCTPNRFHVDVATAAARADCHLFVEKPLSDEMDGVPELEHAVGARDLVTLVGSNLRFLPELRKLKELLAEGAVGPVVAARIEGGSYLPDWFPDSDYRESYSAREDLGGGVILDYIHEINYARWLFGEFDTVSAMAGQRSHLDVETNDVAAILAETTRGVICEFHLDYVQRPDSRSCHVVGERGTIRWSWADGRLEWYVADDDAWHSFERPDEWVTNDMYVDEIEHFLECVERDEETVCPIACGQRDLAVALAARESAATGQNVAVSD